jgi:RHS repeat-associated protein
MTKYVGPTMFTEFLAVNRSGSTPTFNSQYYIKDHLGSIRFTTGNGDTIAAARNYYPYGELQQEYINSSYNARYKFTGKERDTESGLDYFGARYYNSELGRWYSVDPLASKYPGWSSYNYCGNNPLNRIDYDGRGFFIDDMLGGELLAGAAIATGVFILVKTTQAIYNSKDIGRAVNDAIATTGKVMSGYINGAKNLFSKKEAPKANNGKASQHGKKDHDNKVNDIIKKMKEKGYEDIRKNQAQVDANGNKVGDNRPDAAGTDPETGTRVNAEVDRAENSANKHEKTIRANDPDCVIEKHLIK